MKSTSWALENGLVLKMESDGDNLTINVSNGEILVRRLEGSEVFAAFGDAVTDQGGSIKLEILKEEV